MLTSTFRELLIIKSIFFLTILDVKMQFQCKAKGNMLLFSTQRRISLVVCSFKAALD